MSNCEIEELDHLRSVFSFDGTQWLSPVLLSGRTIASYAQTAEARQSVLQVINSLSADAYLSYLREYYHAGDSRFRTHWNYADLLTFLHSSCKFIQPRAYLEIGVRRGRSLAIVANANPDCRIYGFDLWMTNYAGMPNPGPEFVEGELRSCGYRGQLELISGNSHETVPEFLSKNTDLEFDLINVDGDHSEEGAKLDLLHVLPHLAIGGVLLLDDIVHPQHEYLERVWDEVVSSDNRFSCEKYKDLGYGVAVAVRKW